MFDQTKVLLIFAAVCFGSFVAVGAQTPSETPPPPSEPTAFKVPAVRETTLDNGLKVVLVEKKGLPLVTAGLLVKRGAGSESQRLAGLANMTATLLTKGTEYSTSTEIAEQIEYLGGSINSRADWESSTITLNVMKDGLGKALSIMSDAAIRPSFPQGEIELLKKRTLDGFKVSLKQPGSLWSYVASRYSYGEHLIGGTPETVARIRRANIINFHKRNYRPENSVLIFTGDVSETSAFGYAKLFFGNWGQASGKRTPAAKRTPAVDYIGQAKERVIERILVVDLANSGQAAVGYSKRLEYGRAYCEPGGDCIPSRVYFPATVLNSVLGGGYSARLNQEIRLKRGLSYGARSNFGWRAAKTNFSAIAQTKNESAAQVAELVRLEIEKLVNTDVSDAEMKPRKAVVTGGFGRGLQTNNGLAARLRDLYLYDLRPEELNSYMSAVGVVSSAGLKDFAANNLKGGDLIIVGDAKLFMEDLQKRFSNMTIEVIKAENLDLNSDNIRKNTRRRIAK
ncbi:MAG: insulinase family protein [Pyrinomonadaceae bacterium]|nr:insulinase family protein [Pyrinomonadaceae bacterium]